MKTLVTSEQWFVLQAQAAIEDASGRASTSVGMRELLLVRALAEVASGEVGPINAKTYAIEAIVAWLRERAVDALLNDVRLVLEAQLKKERETKKQRRMYFKERRTRTAAR